MLKVQKGNKVAFEELMHKYYPRILNFIYRFVGHKSAAEDLAQEVFLRVYKSASTYKPKSKFQTWIYTIAKNIALNELRRIGRLAYCPDETVDGKKIEFHREIEGPDAASPDEEIMRKEKAAQIRAAIGNLPENQRMALILRRYEEFSYAEIAATLNVSDKAVKSLLSRAKHSLKSQLAHLVRQD